MKGSRTRAAACTVAVAAAFAAALLSQASVASAVRRFRIGSVTKTFTGTVILQLARAASSRSATRCRVISRGCPTAGRTRPSS